MARSAHSSRGGAVAVVARANQQLGCAKNVRATRAAPAATGERQLVRFSQASIHECRVKHCDRMYLTRLVEWRVATSPIGQLDRIPQISKVD